MCLEKLDITWFVKRVEHKFRQYLQVLKKIID